MAYAAVSARTMDRRPLSRQSRPAAAPGRPWPASAPAALRAQPLGLGVHAGERTPPPPHQGQVTVLGRAAEVRDHPAAAAAGHTLPRPVGRLRLIRRCRLSRSPRGDETSVPRMRRPAQSTAGSGPRRADHRRRRGAAAARTSARSRPIRSTTRPCAAWRCPGTTSSSARSSPAGACRSTSRPWTCGCRWPA